MTPALRSLYTIAVDIPDFHEDSYLKVLRPLVEAYLAFARVDNRHIRAMHLTPSRFDVMATLETPTA